MSENQPVSENNVESQLTSPDVSKEDRSTYAVMMTDVFGFSVHVAEREESVERRLAEDLKQFKMIISKFGGKVVADRGDGLKAIFQSPVRAVQAAVAMQEFALGQNAKAAVDDIRIKHRIGIHLGDVIMLEGNVGGMAVTIAARLEQICPPGKICFSDVVHQLTRHEVRVGRTPQGSVELKNLNQPVKVWVARINSDYDYSMPAPKAKSNQSMERLLEAELRDKEYRKGVLTTVLSALLLLTISVSGYFAYLVYNKSNEVDPKLPMVKQNDKLRGKLNPKPLTPESTADYKPAPILDSVPKESKAQDFNIPTDHPDDQPTDDSKVDQKNTSEETTNPDSSNPPLNNESSE